MCARRARIPCRAGPAAARSPGRVVPLAQPARLRFTLGLHGPTRPGPAQSPCSPPPPRPPHSSSLFPSTHVSTLLSGWLAGWSGFRWGVVRVPTAASRRGTPPASLARCRTQRPPLYSNPNLKRLSKFRVFTRLKFPPFAQTALWCWFTRSLLLTPPTESRSRKPSAILLIRLLALLRHCRHGMAPCPHELSSGFLVRLPICAPSVPSVPIA